MRYITERKYYTNNAFRDSRESCRVSVFRLTETERSYNVANTMIDTNKHES